MHTLSLQGITKAYDKVILNDVNIKFNSGKIISILGLSGAGKTTLLSIISGLIKPDNGTIILNEIKLNHKKDNNDFHNYFGMIFQKFQMFNHLNVYENIIAGSVNTLNYDLTKLNQIIVSLNMKEHLHKFPDQLSGGQLQRIGVIRALIKDPIIILADEPTGSLDPENSKEIIKILKSISLDDRLILLSTHDIGIALQSDEVYMLKNGSLQIIDKDKLSEKENLEELYQN